MRVAWNRGSGFRKKRCYFRQFWKQNDSMTKAIFGRHVLMQFLMQRYPPSRQCSDCTLTSWLLILVKTGSSIVFLQINNRVPGCKTSDIGHWFYYFTAIWLVCSCWWHCVVWAVLILQARPNVSYFRRWRKEFQIWCRIFETSNLSHLFTHSSSFGV